MIEIRVMPTNPSTWNSSMSVDFRRQNQWTLDITPISQQQSVSTRSKNQSSLSLLTFHSFGLYTKLRAEQYHTVSDLTYYITMRKTLLGAAVFLSSSRSLAAFQTPDVRVFGQSQLMSKSQLSAVLDPNDVLNSILSMDNGAAAENSISALLSTSLTPSLPSAHGHSNPMFGPPDPFLEAGKSIAPSAKALSSMGITAPNTPAEMIPDASPALQESVSTAMNKGWKFLDSATLQGAKAGINHLPGFSDTHGILGTRLPPLESSESFAAEVKWAAGYFDVMDKLPLVALGYVLLEFFILRPGIDLYKEDIEDDPEGALADSISVTIVRVAAFAFLSVMTVVFA